MRIKPKMTLVLAAVAVICVVFCIVITAWLVFRSQQTATKGRWPQGKQLAGGSSWPVFRGSQQLLGRASGALGDSLKLVWKFKTGDEVNSSAAINAGRVFIGSNDGFVYAVDLCTGGKIWSYETGDMVEASPCVVDDQVFVGSSDGFMYALDAETGELKWKYETDGQILGAANWTIREDDNTTLLVFGSYDGKVYCVDGTTGEVVWEYETGNYVNGTPAIGNDKVVVGGCDAKIHVISLANGKRIKQIDSGAYIAASGAIREGQVYMGNYDGVFLRADIDSGQIVWKYTQEDSPFFSSPAIGKNVVVFGGRDSRLYCVGRDDGKLRWTFGALAEVDSSPVICGDKVVVGSEDGRLYIISLSDGTKVWSYEIGQPVSSSAAIADGMVIIGCDDGYVYAFSAEG
jgi:outer membrane protein assembly factor BamB